MARRPSKSSGSKPVTKPVGVLRIVAPSMPSAVPAASKSTTTTETITPDPNDLSLSSLTLDVPLRPLVARPRRVPATPFHFLTLPSEIRIRIYEYYFAGTEPVIDLGPDNYKRYHKKLGLVRVCRQVHDEATHLFYSSQTFRVFPTHPGRFLKSKKPLLSKFKPVQRQCITSLEVRLGPEWRSPPQGWVVKPALGLHECVNVKKLNIMVECDPSDAVFKGFRRSEGFYEGFCRNLITDVIGELPNVDEVEFDAWPSVKKSGGMMKGLIKTVEEIGLDISWGPLRGWTDADEEVHEEKRLANHLPPGDPYFDLSHWITAS